MRLTDLLSPGTLTNGWILQKEACKAISAVEIQAGYTPGGKTDTARKLQAFFTDCASKLTALVDAVLPTVTTRARPSATSVVVTFSEALTPSTSVPLSSFVFTPTRAFTAVAVTGTTVTITGTGFVVGDTITYTPPTGKLADQGIKDLAGNLAATFTGVTA